MRLWKFLTLFNHDTEEIVFLGTNRPRANSCTLHALLHTVRMGSIVNASGVTSKAANGGHFKTGQRKWPGTSFFYSAPT